MKGKTRRVLLLSGVVVVALLAVAALFLDVRAAQSETNAESSLCTYSSSPEGVEEGPQSGGTLGFYVAGTDDMSDTLRQQLVSVLETNTQFAVVELLESIPEEPGDNHAVLVEIEDKAVTWWAVRASADLAVKITYASDGDLSWRDDEVNVMSAGEGEQRRALLRMEGSFKVKDSTQGFISTVAYEKHLAARVAIEVNKALKRSISDKLVTPACLYPPSFSS